MSHNIMHAIVSAINSQGKERGSYPVSPKLIDPAAMMDYVDRLLTSGTADDIQRATGMVLQASEQLLNTTPGLHVIYKALTGTGDYLGDNRWELGDPIG